ncbi:MAG: sulfate adenylyltransferase subunit CysN [Campylobacterales bacterium]
MGANIFTNTHDKTLLRFITCGSVDDGKSTLIGRLLYDSKALLEDKLGSLKNESKKYGTTGEELDLALLVDGLQAEREQGITIDVAYLFFATQKRKYIIADTPGHEQYTRNMATGASSADAAIILIDARKGVLTQTKRHAYIANLLGIKHIIVAVNKMDIVDYSKSVFDEIKSAFESEVSNKLGLKDVIFAPISALKGDNIVSKSDNTPWYEGGALIDVLDSLELASDSDDRFRLPVQYVNRPNLDFRAFGGTIAGGSIKAGDEIVVLPSGKKTKIKEVVEPSVQASKSPREEFFVGEAISVTTEDEVDISRGDIVAKLSEQPFVSDGFNAFILWMEEEALSLSRRYEFRFAVGGVAGRVENIEFKVDINSYEKEAADSLGLNDIGLCKVALEKKAAFDLYSKNRITGAFIVIDKLTNNTVGAGMIESVSKSDDKSGEHSEFEIELNALIRKHFPHWESKIIK